MKRVIVPIWLNVIKPMNRMIAARYSDGFPIYTVSEFPKSGGTWLGRMVADCLDLPLPQRYRAPIAMPCVMHNHWLYDRRFRRAIYLYRDGRDIMVSFYFHRTRTIARDQDASDRRSRREFEQLFGRGYDPEDAAKHLPRFIEHTFAHPRGSHVNWATHIDSWYDPPNRPHVAYVSYEDLLADTSSVLKRTLEHVAGREIEPWRIEAAVDKYSMARQTGRAPGEEDRGSFIRKGVAGDWRNHFTREAAEVFHDLAGSTLIRLGYEPDGSWVTRLGSEGASPE